MRERRYHFHCALCGHHWFTNHGARPTHCPACSGKLPVNSDCAPPAQLWCELVDVADDGTETVVYRESWNSQGKQIYREETDR